MTEWKESFVKLSSRDYDLVLNIINVFATYFLLDYFNLFPITVSNLIETGF